MYNDIKIKSTLIGETNISTILFKTEQQSELTYSIMHRFEFTVSVLHFPHITSMMNFNDVLLKAH